MDWATFRSNFPVTARWAFFDHAAVAPLPTPAVRALAEYADDLSHNGIASVRRWVNRAKDVRRLAARLLNADLDEVAFIKNTSEGVGFVAEGFPWRPGDNVVIAAEEFPANQYPWMNQAGKGVEVRAVPSRGSRVAIDDVHDAIDARTRIVSLSSVEFASGFRNDLDAVGGLCRERGVLFFVDAIQSLGVFPLDVKRTPVDFLAADSHKWLLGPEGIGIFWIRRDLIDQLHPVSVGWNSVVDATNFTKIDFRLKPSAGRWEGGAANVAGINAMGASLELLLSVDRDEIRRRVEGLTDRLCEWAPASGLEVFSSRRPGEASGIVSLATPGRDPDELLRRCREAGIIVNQRAGRLRLSPHAYNTPEEIDRFLECVKK
jgi:selenocysteine lyase/cysteine desulfurase